LSVKLKGPGPRPRKGMKRGLPDLIRRQRAVEKTQARFAGKVFELGSNDCVKLARAHLKAMGHELPSTGHYSTAMEARAALKKQGVKNLEHLLDRFLTRIPPAMMLLGDVALLKSEPEEASASEFGTLVINAGSKFIGWHPDKADLAVMDVLLIDAAWRA